MNFDSRMSLTAFYMTLNIFTTSCKRLSFGILSVGKQIIWKKDISSIDIDAQLHVLGFIISQLLSSKGSTENSCSSTILFSEF
jgi:hypothetical protein